MITYIGQCLCSNIILTLAPFLINKKILQKKQTTSMCYIYCIAFTQS